MYYIVVEPSGEDYICYNVETYEEVERIIQNGGWEVPKDDVERIFGRYTNIVSPLNTKVSKDGKQIVFTPPNLEEEKNEAASLARAQRNTLLMATDYLLMPDYPIDTEKKQAIIVYRQALRDISKQVNWPLNINWPVKPEI